MPRLDSLPEPEERPLLPLWPDAGHWLDIGRATTYRLAKDGEFPIEVLQIGGQLRVRNIDLRRFLGMA